MEDGGGGFESLAMWEVLCKTQMKRERKGEIKKKVAKRRPFQRRGGTTLPYGNTMGLERPQPWRVSAYSASSGGREEKNIEKKVQKVDNRS